MGQLIVMNFSPLIIYYFLGKIYKVLLETQNIFLLQDLRDIKKNCVTQI